ncbi:hypothetical protein E2493_09735 [Sphingomonas parva]|uniref:YbbD head domain-containing protein n=1 Tax=Sphingomonas parva TaxID=2555898 RepID=A0A4Y8ZQV4_9SPHN|nr:hypothetical protein [Sphingomonas parva]TFI58408.1 hypothetical protein E2493_09735 [Sphingomonas parva]
MRKLVAVSVVTSLFACSDQKEERYATWAEANRAGAVERGWLPPFVPKNARDLHDTHDLDTNEQKLTFTVPPEAVRPMLDSIAPRSVLEGKLAAKALDEAGWKASEAQDVVATLLCTRSYSGTVVANRRTGRTVYLRPSEWAMERCPRPL